MNTRKWILVTSLVVVLLIAVVALVPAVFAQSPLGPGYGNGLLLNSGNGQAGGQMMRGEFGPQTQMMGQRMGRQIANGQGMMSQGTGPGFVDEDGDGVCDHAGTGQGMGRGQGTGQGFVDADGDGVCDHAGTGQGMGRGRGTGFVDADGDGVCDHAATGQAAK